MAVEVLVTIEEPCKESGDIEKYCGENESCACPGHITFMADTYDAEQEHVEPTKDPNGQSKRCGSRE